MKRSKLLLATPCVALATITPVCACSQTTEAQNIVDAIFGPLDIKANEISSFETELKKLSSEELNNELVYDLFALAPLAAGSGADFVVTMKDLYKNETIGLQTNITKKSLSFDKDKRLVATFLGYVSFVFLKDYTESDRKFKTNDYIMLTFDMVDLPVGIDETTCSLIYKDNLENIETCIGFIKMRWEDGKEEHMVPIESINLSEIIGEITIPHNSKNWTKTA